IAFLGFPPGGALALLVIGRLETPIGGLIGGTVAGIVIGTAQWLALRGRLKLTPLWIAATALGLGAGLGVGVALFGAETTLVVLVQRAVPTGVLLGVAQGVVLRQRLSNTAGLLWGVAVALVYPVAWVVTAQVIGASVNNSFVVFGASGALLFQAITGGVLWAVLRAAAPAPQA
ncbi:MAG: hypothetical protein H7Y11_16000, partial [Armatimonadetes bacterium]|nr:hypothetical protein [Anaerolineae bacterium]